LGGLTSLWLGGIEADEKSFKTIMDQKYSRWSDWPEYAKKQAASVNWKQATSSYYDERIKAIIAFAPDLGQAFKTQGLRLMKASALIIVGDKDLITPAAENATFYATSIPGAKIEIVKGAGHFTFLNSCSALGETITPQLCRDDLDRNGVHAEASDVALGFLSDIWKNK
jgi:predicted dienelactone hydrolase